MIATDDLDRLKAAYREQRIAEARISLARNGPEAVGSADEKRQREELRQFCLAGGHDLAELTSFFQQVDQEIIHMLAF